MNKLALSIARIFRDRSYFLITSQPLSSPPASVIPLTLPPLVDCIVLYNMNTNSYPPLLYMSRAGCRCCCGARTHTAPPGR